VALGGWIHGAEDNLQATQRLCVAVLCALSHIVLPISASARRTGSNQIRVILLRCFLMRADNSNKTGFKNEQLAGMFAWFLKRK
jgi:hypothetical protein